MKISFVGNFSVNYSSESHYMKTFKQLGHEVITHQENTPIKDIDTLANCDLLFWVHTHGWQTDGLEELISDLRSKNIPVVGYHLDLWLGIARERDLERDLYWKSLDYFFCTDVLMVDWLNKREDYPRAFFLPAGVFEGECYLAQPNLKRYPHEVIFVGSRGYHPEWPYRKQLIEWLESTYGDRFAQYGGGGRGTIRGHDLNQLYASSKIVIGDTLCKNFDYPYYLSDRIFETTGRGGAIIHPYITGLENLFDIGREILTYDFGDFEQLKFLIDLTLSGDERREEMRLAGHARTKSDHTYTHRLSNLLETVKENA